MADRRKRAVPPDDPPGAVRPVETDPGALQPRRDPSPRPEDGWGRRLSALLALGALATVGILLVRFQTSPEPEPEVTTTLAAEPPQPDLRAYRDPEGRFRLGLPEGWRLVTDTVATPNGFTDVFAAATFDPQPGGGGCPHVPVQALEDLGPEDALVWMEHAPANEEAASRPSFAELVVSPPDDEAAACLSAEGRADLGSLQTFTFAEGGRGYRGVVAAGGAASEERITETVAVLDSFEPGFWFGPDASVADIGWDGARLWVVSHDGASPPPNQAKLTAVDTATGEILSEVTLAGPADLVAADAAAVWVAHSGSDTMTRIDPASGAVVDEVDLAVGRGAADIAVQGGAAWVLVPGHAVFEVGGAGDVVAHELPAGNRAEALVLLDGAPWVASGNSVRQIGSGRAAVELDHAAEGLGAAGDRLLVYGPAPEGGYHVSIVDAGLGGVVDGFDVASPVVAIATIEGVTGALDAEGYLHPAANVARLTDAPAGAVLGQAGSGLWAAPEQAPWILDIRFVHAGQAQVIDVEPLSEAEIADFAVVRGPDDRFAVAVPPDWEVTTESLSPLGGVGGDLFAAGTFELRPTADVCVHLPTRAVETMRPSDAFVWVEDAGAGSFPGLPGSFADLVDGVDDGSMIHACLSPLARVELGVLEWITFSRAGRDFYAILAAGREAPDRRLSEAVAILDSFEPALSAGPGNRVSRLGWDGERIWALTGVPTGDTTVPARAGVVAVDPVSGDRRGGAALSGGPALLAGDAESVWVAHAGTGHLTRLDRDTGQVEAEVELPSDGGTPWDLRGLVADGGVVWVLGGDGALAELAGDAVTVHDLGIDHEPRALAVVSGVPWVAAGPALYRVEGGEVSEVSLDHEAEQLGGVGDLLLVAGAMEDGGQRVTWLDAGDGGLVTTFTVQDEIAAIVTVEGVTGALDSDGVLHLVDRSIAPTDYVPGGRPTVQAGPDLYVAAGSWLRRVRLADG